jgi:hypothetical protein
VQGHLIFSFIGELQPGDRDREHLVIHRVVTCDASLDNRDVAIHTQWILFDEPMTCSVGVWPEVEDRGAPLFQITRTLEPEAAPGTLARLCTVSVRVRREVLTPASLYWVKVFRDDELVTQYPLKLSAGTPPSSPDSPVN